MQEPTRDLYFSDHFGLDPKTIDKHGAFDISLVTDLPLFIDPFLLFNSSKVEYQELHEEIIKYLKFLRDKSVAGPIEPGLIKALFVFSEVRQTWLGYSVSGNRGSGLGSGFASALNANLNTVFKSFGDENVTAGSHLEKLCLIRSGVGRDNVSDFTTNLIKRFLLEYTQQFALQHLSIDKRRTFRVPRVAFNYKTETWMHDDYELPLFQGDYVLLTPRDILTKDEIWINRADLIRSLESVADAIPNEQLRAQINNYFRQRLTKKPKQKEIDEAAEATIQTFPEVIEYYIKSKEDDGDEARKTSDLKVAFSNQMFVQHVGALVNFIDANTPFYSLRGGTLDEARQRVAYFKDCIENKGQHRLFYSDGQPIRRESDAQLMFRLTWIGSPSDVSTEVNDGRGPVDYKVSRGAFDKTLIEFKLASNSHLKRNLQKQTPIYEKASDAPVSLKVILYFTEAEQKRVVGILTELQLTGDPNIILIDARNDNKPSGSKAS